MVNPLYLAEYQQKKHLLVRGTNPLGRNNSHTLQKLKCVDFHLSGVNRIGLQVLQRLLRKSFTHSASNNDGCRKDLGLSKCWYIFVICIHNLRQPVISWFVFKKKVFCMFHCNYCSIMKHLDLLPSLILLLIIKIIILWVITS